MAHSLSDDQVRLLRLRAQHLDSRRTRSVTGVRQVVRDVCGVQAQDVSTAALAVRARCAGIAASDVEGTRVLVTVLPDEDTQFWLQASQSVLAAVWGNDEDEVYAQLLEV